MIAEQVVPLFMAAVLFYRLGPPKRSQLDPKLMAELRAIEREIDAEIGSDASPAKRDQPEV